jgi:hypothetical protein
MKSALRRVRLPLPPWLSLLLLLGIAAVLIGVGSSTQGDPPYDLASEQPGGLRALRLWLEALDYKVVTTDGPRFVLRPELDLLFVYPNRLPYNRAEAEALRAWVATGKTLVLVGPAPEDTRLAETFGVQGRALDSGDLLLSQSMPLLPDAGAGVSRSAGYGSAEGVDLTGVEGALAALVTDEGKAAMAVQRVGNGLVWHLGEGVALTNAQLQYYAQGVLLPPLLRSAPAGATVAFDTFHLFGKDRSAERIVTLQDWLYGTYGGWATLVFFTLTALYLLLQGQRLGPPLLTAADVRRRAPEEFVTAMAGLYRRAGKSREAAAHYRRRLRQEIQRRHPLAAELADGLVATRLAESAHPPPAAVLEEIRALLAQPEQAIQDEVLVRYAARIEALLKERW